jgi:electron transfer flavoprotein beta subunit
MPKIVVLVKYTPDLTADRSFLADGTVDRASVAGQLSELDEYAVEQALRVKESTEGWDLTYVTMGPDGAQEALRKALSMGGDAAVHVRDDALHGSDAFATSLVLAAAIQRTGFDVVLAGMAAADRRQPADGQRRRGSDRPRLRHQRRNRDGPVARCRERDRPDR